MGTLVGLAETGGMGAKEGNKVGRTLGSVVGLRLGRIVGLLVGCKVGRIEGHRVGATVGRCVGSTEGLTVGLYVMVGPLLLGWLVGCGETDGAEVGLLLGWLEGELEGCAEGFAVGAAVGRRVGGNSILLVATRDSSVVVIGKLFLIVDLWVAAKDTLCAKKMVLPSRFRDRGRRENVSSVSTAIRIDCVKYVFFDTEQARLNP